MLKARPVDPRDLKRAEQVFREESPKSFVVDLADLTRDTWSLLPGDDDFLAEIRTRRFDTLTYARSAARARGHLALRAHAATATSRSTRRRTSSRRAGRFYNEDDLAPSTSLDYDIDVTAMPDRQWIEGRAVMRLRVRAPTLGTADDSPGRLAGRPVDRQRPVRTPVQPARDESEHDARQPAGDRCCRTPR